VVGDLPQLVEDDRVRLSPEERVGVELVALRRLVRQIARLGRMDPGLVDVDEGDPSADEDAHVARAVAVLGDLDTRGERGVLVAARPRVAAGLRLAVVLAAATRRGAGRDHQHEPDRHCSNSQGPSAPATAPPSGRA